MNISEVAVFGSVGGEVVKFPVAQIGRITPADEFPVTLTDGFVAGGELSGLTLGLNWHPNSATRLMFNYILNILFATIIAYYVLFPSS